MTSPQCTAQGKYLFHMACFTGLAYFLAPQSVNWSPFLRKSLFTTLCNATRREAGLSEKQSDWKHEVFLNEPSFEVSPGQQGGLDPWEMDVVPIHVFLRHPDLVAFSEE